ncbi:MAG: ribosomal protein S18-alanine N-acetyltransferase [Pseudomonadota bacterium]
MPYDPADLDEMMEIENLSFTAPWSRNSYEELSPLDTIHIWIAKLKKRVVGYMLFQNLGEDIELHTLAVAPALRRKGIARKLMDHMIAEGRRFGIKRIFLQVRPSNASARPFYEDLGFKPIGLRRAYYRDDGEDAMVMKLELKG